MEKKDLSHFERFITGDIDWNKKIEEELNPAQNLFATVKAPVLMGLAGPGSGKTRALVYRASHLIKSGILPRNIMLVTFTNKAADEMKLRLENLLGERPEDMWAGTFHSSGARILRIHAHMVERSNRFTILDESDRAALLKICMESQKESMSEGERTLFIRRGFMGRVISQAVNSAGSLESILDEYYPDQLDYADFMVRVAGRYEQAKKESNAFDFDDLLVKWLQLFLNNGEVLEKYRRRFAHILVDEFQDSNPIQGRLVDLLAARSAVCVVGDDAQSIYSFRFAHVDNMINFPDRHPGCLIVRMEQNYRSTPQIVELADRVISFNRHQLHKRLYSINPEGRLPCVVSTPNASGEASFVVGKVGDLLAEGVPLREMAVLYRNSYLTQAVEIELLNQGIVYRTYGGVKMMHKAHIKDILAWFKVLYNPRDGVSWRRLIGMHPGLGPSSADYVLSLMAASADPLTDILSGKIAPRRGKQGWEALLRVLKEIRAGEPVPDTIYSILRSGYWEIMRKLYPDDWEERYLSIEQLASESLRFNGPDEFLEKLTLEDTLFLERDSDHNRDFLTLSTIHSAKGKEWDAVFILALNEGRFPNSRDDVRLEEERRLFYVAASRARKFLYLSTYRLDYYRGGYLLAAPSLFLQELPPGFYETLYLE